MQQRVETPTTQMHAIEMTTVCSHRWKLCVRQYANQKGQHYMNICLDCGKVGSAYKHEELTEDQRAAAHQVNEEKLQALREVFSSRKTSEWFTRYAEYRLTPEWQKLRTLVLERDHFLCQACLAAPATIAHHLSYKHVFHEFIFELIAVCAPCHARLHAEDAEN